MSRRVWPGLLLCAYAAALALGALPSPSADVSDLLEARSLRGLAETLGRVLLAASIAVGRFVPLGVLARWSLGGLEGGRLRRLPAWAAALALAWILVIVTSMVAGGRPWRLPTAPDLFLPTIGVLVGLWLGAMLARGWRGAFAAVGVMVAALMILAGIGAAVLFAAIEPQRAALERPLVTSAEKRRLYALFKDKNPAEIPPGDTRTLRLTPSDLDLLTAWGLSLGPDRFGARISCSDGEATLQASAMLTSSRYLNLRATGAVAAGDGALRLHARELRLGAVAVPPLLLDLLSPLVSRTLSSDRRVKPVLAAIREVSLSPEGVAVTYGRGALPPGFVADLFHGRDGREELPIVALYVERLLEAPMPADKDARFLHAVQQAFALAAERSKTGSAVVENRAAIVALGMLVGHPRLESLVGEVMTEKQRREARHLHGTSTLRGREDWPQHFFVSAGLAVVAVAAVSDATGLLKEELDAGGGSGFSFGDLLADRSGTTFAAVATRDEPSARGLQARLAAGPAVDDIFPDTAGLPENIQDAELQARYGGVGGTEYRRLAEEVERRVAACPAYR